MVEETRPAAAGSMTAIMPCRDRAVTPKRVFGSVIVASGPI
jgi:hypothetical protein